MANVGVIPLLNVLSGAVALLVSYYAYKNNKLVRSNLLMYISAGFLLLGIGLFFEAGTEISVGRNLVEEMRLRGVGLIEFLISTALQLVAYAVFAWGYGLSALRGQRDEQPLPSAATTTTTTSLPAIYFAAATTTVTRKLIEYALFLAIFLASQLGILALLVFIVYHGAAIFSRTKSYLALMVLFAFTLILAARLILFSSALLVSSVLLLIGDTIQFCGFLSLLFFLFWSARVVK